MKIRADLADYWLTPSLLKGIGAMAQRSGNLSDL